MTNVLHREPNLAPFPRWTAAARDFLRRPAAVPGEKIEGGQDADQLAGGAGRPLAAQEDFLKATQEQVYENYRHQDVGCVYLTVEAEQAMDRLTEHCRSEGLVLTKDSFTDLATGIAMFATNKTHITPANPLTARDVTAAVAILVAISNSS